MQARALARRKKRELELEPSGSYTLRDAFKFWCSKKKGRISSYRDEKLRLEKYVVSKLGSRQLDSITPPVLIKLLEPVETAGKLSTVKRLLMRVREIFDLAVNAGFLQANPLSKITKVFPVPEVRHMPSIDWKELPIVISQIEAKAAPKYRALFFFTGHITSSGRSCLRPNRLDLRGGDHNTSGIYENEKDSPDSVDSLPHIAN